MDLLGGLDVNLALVRLVVDVLDGLLVVNLMVNLVVDQRWLLCNSCSEGSGVSELLDLLDGHVLEHFDLLSPVKKGSDVLVLLRDLDELSNHLEEVNKRNERER